MKNYIMVSAITFLIGFYILPILFNLGFLLQSYWKEKYIYKKIEGLELPKKHSRKQILKSIVHCFQPGVNIVNAIYIGVMLYNIRKEFKVK